MEEKYQWSISNAGPEAKVALHELLAATMVRHTKDHLRLFEPIREQVVLDTAKLQMTEADALAKLDSLAQGDVLTDNDNIIDKLKAQYIYSAITSAQARWQRNRRMDASRRSSVGIGNGYGSFMGYSYACSGGNSDIGAVAQSHVPLRRPKCIIFSTDGDHLSGVGHFLYLWMGERSICEHGGIHRDATARKFMAESRSSELSRFRSSMRKYRQCPLCGCENSITSGPTCLRTLLLIEYEEEVLPEQQDSSATLTSGTQATHPVRTSQAQTQQSSLLNKAQSSATTAVSGTLAGVGFEAIQELHLQRLALAILLRPVPCQLTFILRKGEEVVAVTTCSHIAHPLLRAVMASLDEADSSPGSVCAHPRAAKNCALIQKILVYLIPFTVILTVGYFETEKLILTEATTKEESRSCGRGACERLDSPDTAGTQGSEFTLIPQSLMTVRMTILVLNLAARATRRIVDLLPMLPQCCGEVDV